MRAQCTPPAGFEGVEKGEVLPWAQWDWRAETRHVVLHFGAGEVERIWEGVSGGGRGGARGEEKGEGVKGEGKNEKGRISRQDALLAFLWLLINRARGLSGSSDLVYMTISLGLRTRLSPPLPSTFLGSPIIHARAFPSLLDSPPPLKTSGPSPRRSAVRLRSSMRRLLGRCCMIWRLRPRRGGRGMRFWDAGI